MIDTTQTQRDGHVRALLARCEHLGVIAVARQLGASRGEGHVWMGTHGAGETLALHAHVRGLCEMLCANSVHEDTKELTTVAPGIRAGRLLLRDESGMHAVVMMLYPQGVALEGGGLFASWLQGRGLEGLGRWTEASAQSTNEALLRWSEDLSKLAHTEVDAQTFTQQLTHAFDTIDLMYQLGRSMKKPSLPEQFLGSMCERVRTTLNFGWMVAHFGGATETPKTLRGRTFWDGQLPEAQPVVEAYLRDLLTHETIHNGPAPSLGELACGQVAMQTLTHKDKVVGVLIVGGKFGDDPDVSSYDTQLLEATAGFLGSFIDNVALYDDQDDLFVGTVQAMTAAIDAKDSYTCGHSERVALLSLMVARAAGLSPDACNEARIGGLVHDVGKIGVPEGVLCKPGKLTEEEFGHIKKHPEIGHRILRGVKLLTSMLPGVLHHHERWDGRGYPHGLKGEQIPMLARVIAVADTFDAMSSDRSYRKKLDREHVLAEIVRSGGTQLDPALAPLILKIDLGAYDALAQKHAKDHAPAQLQAAAAADEGKKRAA
jgi:HD-GYP domain-containing protein (c-di-GMP phosphodiesterase class II)